MSKEGKAKQVWAEKDAAVCKITEDSHQQPPGRAEGNTQVLLFSQRLSILQNTIMKGLPIWTIEKYQPVTIFSGLGGMAPLCVQGRCFL